MKNLFEKDFDTRRAGQEHFETLLERKNISIKKIVSWDLRDGEWYLQEEDEWVVLLEGSALIEYESELKALRAGEYLYIPRATKHRVKETSSDALWLAVYIS
ncbi:MAG: cupin domain-containing protein [Helicobacteraceae bacterium]|nr:cupin domain-containing protein [Helicobacteraceae bacterium]